MVDSGAKYINNYAMNEEEKQIENSDNHIEKQNDKPWLWRKGQSGNPKGRPKGKTAKERAKDYLLRMTDEEFEDFLVGIDKKTIWEMAEGKAKQDIGLRATVTISDVLNELDGSTPKEQEVETQSPVQDPQ